MALSTVGTFAGANTKISLENPTLNHLSDALHDTVGWLRQEEIPYFLTGAVAEALLWRPQLTRCISVLAVTSESRLFEKMASLRQFALVGEPCDEAESCTVFLRHATSLAGVAMTARTESFERQAAGRALCIDFNGLELRVPTPEDFVLLQTRAGKADADDIEAILKTYPQADRDYMLQYLSSAPQGARTERVAAALQGHRKTADFQPVRSLVTM
jgi:hypothetical protein